MKALLIVAVCVAGSLGVSWTSTSQPKAEAEDSARVVERYRNSHACEASGDYVGAIRALDGAPESYLRELRLGWLNYQKKSNSVAERHYQNAIKINPAALGAKLGLMLPLIARSQWAEVEAVGRQVTRLDAYNYYGNLRLAYALRQQKKYPQAEEVATLLLKLYPTDSSFLAEYAYARTGQKLAVRSRSTLKTQEDVDNFERSYKHEQEQKYDEAISALASSARRAPNDYGLNVRLGWLYYLKGEYATSNRHYERALSMSFNVEANLGRTLPLIAQKNYPELQNVASRILLHDPGNYYGSLRLAYAYRMQKQYEQAERILGPLLLKYPTDVNFLGEMIQVRLGQGQTAEVQKLRQLLRLIDPDNTLARQAATAQTTPAGE